MRGGGAKELVLFEKSFTNTRDLRTTGFQKGARRMQMQQKWKFYEFLAIFPCLDH